MIFETVQCCGCRTCEMACSFHHKGVFGSNISSIRVLDREEELGFAIPLAEKTAGKTIACDGCKGRDEPFCVKYCTEGDELKEILNKFSQNR